MTKDRGPVWTPNHGKPRCDLEMTVDEWYTKPAWYQRNMVKLWRTGVDFQVVQKLPVEPYLLGVWLGDGNSCNTGFTFSRELKSELVEYLHGVAADYQLDV